MQHLLAVFALFLEVPQACLKPTVRVTANHFTKRLCDETPDIFGELGKPTLLCNVDGGRGGSGSGGSGRGGSGRGGSGSGGSDSGGLTPLVRSAEEQLA
jgi:hypothetical protein